MTVLERVQAGWKIRRENRWWLPDFCGPITFCWQKPNGRKGVDLTEQERREMAKLGRAKTLVPISQHEKADPPYELIGIDYAP